MAVKEDSPSGVAPNIEQSDKNPGALPKRTTSQPLSNSHAVKWYRSPFYNATILGMCSFAAPGLWGAMNSLGAGKAPTHRYTLSLANHTQAAHKNPIWSTLEMP